MGFTTIDLAYLEQIPNAIFVPLYFHPIVLSRIVTFLLNIYTERCGIVHWKCLYTLKSINPLLQLTNQDFLIKFLLLQLCLFLVFTSRTLRLLAHYLKEECLKLLSFSFEITFDLSL